MRRLLMTLLFVTACADGDGTDAAEFPATGSYASVYRVPADASLSAAAVYEVDHVDWTVTGDTVTLHYDLPVGLVGGDVDVTFMGTLDGSDKLPLAGPNGTGSCTATASRVTCTEDFTNLGTLPVSMDVVLQRAAIEYSGPASHRRDVATVFGSDPIGIVEIDLTRPVVDDKGGGNDD